MAKPKARSKTSDPLLEPIKAPNLLAAVLIAEENADCPAAQAAVWEIADDWIARQQRNKLLLLAQRRGVDISLGEPLAWAVELCLKLAEERYDGFKIASADLKLKSPGRPRGSGKVDPLLLYAAVQARLNMNSENIAEACRSLSRERKGPWSGMKSKTLETRYHEFGASLKKYSKRIATGTASYQKPSEDAYLDALRAAAALARSRSTKL